MTYSKQIEYSDIVEDLNSLEGLTGRFIMSLENGNTFEVPFYFDGTTRTLQTHGIQGHELVEFRDQFHKDAREAWMANRDAVRDMN